MYLPDCTHHLDRASHAGIGHLAPLPDRHMVIMHFAGMPQLVRRIQFGQIRTTLAASVSIGTANVILCLGLFRHTLRHDGVKHERREGSPRVTYILAPHTRGYL